MYIEKYVRAIEVFLKTHELFLKKEEGDSNYVYQACCYAKTKR